jgi:hypothetical protein
MIFPKNPPDVIGSAFITGMTSAVSIPAHYLKTAFQKIFYEIIQKNMQGEYY